MAAPDRIRLTSSLRKGPGNGALLFARTPEDPGLAGLRPAVLDANEPAKAPSGEQLKGLGIPRPVGVVEQEVTAWPHLLHRRFEAVDPSDRRRLEEVEHDQIEGAVSQRPDLIRKLLDGPQPEVDISQSILIQPLAGPRVPELVVLEADHVSRAAREPGGRPAGPEFQDRPVGPHSPAEPPD